MRLAAPGEQEWSPVYLCAMAQHRVWHAIGAQLMFVDWMDGWMCEKVPKPTTY